MRKIKGIKSEIDEIRSENFEMNLSIHRDGKDIVKEYNDTMRDKVNQLES